MTGFRRALRSHIEKPVSHPPGLTYPHAERFSGNRYAPSTNPLQPIRGNVFIRRSSAPTVFRILPDPTYGTLRAHRLPPVTQIRGYNVGITNITAQPQTAPVLQVKTHFTPDRPKVSGVPLMGGTLCGDHRTPPRYVLPFPSYDPTAFTPTADPTSCARRAHRVSPLYVYRSSGRYHRQLRSFVLYPVSHSIGSRFLVFL